MPRFGIAIGHDALAEDVEDFIPYQPLTEGLQYTKRTPTVEGIVDEAAFIRFMFGILDEAQNTAMLTQAGVLTANTAEVTIYAQNENYVWGYFNGTAVKPLNQGRKGYFLYNVPLLVRGVFVAATVP